MAAIKTISQGSSISGINTREDDASARMAALQAALKAGPCQASTQERKIADALAERPDFAALAKKLCSGVATKSDVARFHSFARVEQVRQSANQQRVAPPLSAAELLRIAAACAKAM